MLKQVLTVWNHVNGSVLCQIACFCTEWQNYANLTKSFTSADLFRRRQHAVNDWIVDIRNSWQLVHCINRYPLTCGTWLFCHCRESCVMTLVRFTVLPKSLRIGAVKTVCIILDFTEFGDSIQRWVNIIDGRCRHTGLLVTLQGLLSWWFGFLLSKFLACISLLWSCFDWPITLRVVHGWKKSFKYTCNAAVIVPINTSKAVQNGTSCSCPFRAHTHGLCQPHIVLGNFL